MVSVKVIQRRMPCEWQTLLVVNGAIGRAEELLCLEERPAHPHLTKQQVQAIFLAWLGTLPGPHTRTDHLSLEHWGMKELVLIPPPLPEETLHFIDVIHRTAESVSFGGSSKERND